MSISLQHVAAIIDNRWTAFKAAVAPKFLSMQYDQDSIGYTIFAFDGPVAYRTYIWTGTLPDSDPSYNQAQNDADKADFETNYKDHCNGQIESNDRDSRIIHRLGNLTTASLSEVLVSAAPYTDPGGQAQRSLVSTSINDANPAGSGARIVRVCFLNNAYVRKIEDVALNGTTPVNMVATDVRYIEYMRVIAGTVAAGTISLKTLVAGGGTNICQINSATEETFMAHHYVPAGMTCLILGWSAIVNDDVNMKLKGQTFIGGNTVDVNLDLDNSGAITPPGRVILGRKFDGGMMQSEKTYIRLTATPGQTASTVTRATLDLWETKA